MQSYHFAGRLALDDLRAIERPLPAPGPGQLLLRMEAAALNFRDLAIASGTYGAFPLPLVPLSDGAGRVVAHGVGAEGFAVGDLVCPHYVPDWHDGPARPGVIERRLGGPLDGVLREYLCVDAGAVVRAPAHLSAREAATLPIAAVTAWQALFADGHVAAGDTVAVPGSGGVSLFVVQLARAAGARVISLLRDPDRAAALEALGAEVVDSRRADWPDVVRAASGGRGVDLFVDVVGGAMLAPAIAATRIGGAVVLLGFVGGTSATIDLVAAIRRVVTLRAVSGGSRASFEQVVDFLARHELRPIIDRVFPFERAADAYRHLASGRPFGKVVVEIAGSLSGGPSAA